MNYCSLCHSAISPERIYQNPIICDSCGHVHSRAESKASEGMNGTNFFAYVIVSSVIILSYMAVATWDNYAIPGTALFMKEKVIGLTIPEKDRFAKICFELKKYDCVEKLYAELAISGGEAELSQLGELQFRRQKYPDAVMTMQRLLVLSPRDLEARYTMARALSEIGRIDEAVAHFEWVLRAKPGVHQITVAQKYIDYLVKANRMDQAQRVINRYKLPIAIGSKVSALGSSTSS